MALGGPMVYTGKDMRAAHSHMALTDAHFVAVVAHLQSTLEELGVAPPRVEEVLKALDTTRSDVLNR
jgi:hemoglobin